MNQSTDSTQLRGHADARQLLDYYQISSEDLERIREFGTIAIPQMETVVKEWYGWLETQPEYSQFFPDQETLDRRYTSHSARPNMPAEIKTLLEQELREEIAWWKRFQSPNTTIIEQQRATG